MSNLERHLDQRTGASDDIEAARSKNGGATCVVYTNHPLAFRTIANAIASDPGQHNSVKPYSDFKVSNGSAVEILILDLCSVAEWQEALRRWHAEGGRTIVLVSPNMQSVKEESRMLSLGIAGMVTFSDDITTTLPGAIETVKQEKLWATQEALEEYIRRTNTLLRHLSSAERVLTAREQQIVDLLREGLSNKEISRVLGISERTAKFHVSNLLKKCEADNRWAFLTASEAEKSVQLRLVGGAEDPKGQANGSSRYRSGGKQHAEPKS